MKGLKSLCYIAYCLKFTVYSFPQSYANLMKKENGMKLLTPFSVRLGFSIEFINRNLIDYL